MKRVIRIGYTALLILFGGVGGWAALTSIHGAIVAQGAIEKEGKNKVIQHAKGGIIKTLHVREGHLVKRGDALVTFDGTRTRTERSVVSKRVFEAEVKQQRFVAARDGLEQIEVSPEIRKQAGHDDNLHAVIKVQEQLFRNRLERSYNQKAQLAEQISQIEAEITGLIQQQNAIKQQRSVLQDEIADLTALHKKGLISQQRLNVLRRELAEADRKKGRLTSQIAEARGRITEVRLKIVEIDQVYHDDALKMLAETESELSTMREQLITAQDSLDRLVLRAPQTGFVHDLVVSTEGGVVAGGEKLMRIVPSVGRMVIQAHIRPNDIDQLEIGQKVDIRFSAFNQRTTPLAEGRVTFISPDQQVNERSGESYFTARIALEDSSVAALGKNTLLPGMPAEVMILTPARTVLGYLAKPLSDQYSRTFREN